MTRSRGDAGSFPAAAMSIDVEEWYQVENLRSVIAADSWKRQQSRLERQMERMLLLMETWDVRATCFVLGSVAERTPSLVRRIVDAGHEIASHGYAHRLIYELDPAAFRGDVETSKRLLEDLTGERVIGYRAPSFSLTEWALPVLRDAGFEYDSSLFGTSIPHGRYGKVVLQGAEEGVARTREGLAEVSLSCLRVGRYSLPWAGGGYFRLIPYPVFRAGIRRILGSRRPYIFYIHPWELDPQQPRVPGLKRSERLRHYLNLEKTEARWSSLLADFEWVTIRDLIAHERSRTGAEQSLNGGPVPRNLQAARRAEPLHPAATVRDTVRRD
jgi:polysaccharide deacetylase family protein (PEP-CTERM system associated)